MSRYEKGSPCQTCPEGRVRYVKSGECANCYNRRYVAEHYDAHRERVNEYQRRWREGKWAVDQGDEMPQIDTSKRIAYSSAHSRVARWRGRAAIHQCARCEKPAVDWAYRGGAEHEFIADVPHRKGVGFHTVAYSGDPMDYDPLCRGCHVSFDVREPKVTDGAGGNRRGAA